MKTMQNFLGSMGDFKTGKTSTGKHKVIDNHGFSVATLGYGIQSEYDARLFANSKKVLEAAIDAHKALNDEQTLRGGGFEFELSKLENAINDSL